MSLESSFPILIFGIGEREPKLKSSERKEKDLSTAKKNLIEKVDPSNGSTEDVHWIGKFTPDHKPRLVVDTFQWDKRIALRNSYMLKNANFFLKPMLTSENEPWKQQLSLHFKLSNLGVPKQEIKVLNYKFCHRKTVLDHLISPDVLAKQTKDN